MQFQLSDDVRLALDVFLPLALVAAGIGFGFLVEKVVLRWLDALAARTRWTGDNILLRAVRGLTVFWGFAMGLYLATLTLDPESARAAALIDVFQKLLLVAVIWTLTIIGARIAGEVTTDYTSRSGTALPATSIIANLVQLAVYVLGILFVLSSLGVAIAPVLTALGVGGLAIALALQDTLANIFAGLYLIASREINPGDYVRLEEGEEGYIVDIKWRSTSIRTLLETIVIVPNSKVASSVLTNYHLLGHRMRLRVAVMVDYESDLDAVERVTLDVARAVQREVAPDVTEEPEVYLHAFGEFSLNLTVVLSVGEFYDQYRLRHLFMKELLRRYRQEDIHIPFPIKEFEMGVDPIPFDSPRPTRLGPPDVHGDVAEG